MEPLQPTTSYATYNKDQVEAFKELTDNPARIQSVALAAEVIEKSDDVVLDMKEKKLQLPSTKRDRFNCQLGKEPARINAVLTNQPQTDEAIANQVGLTPKVVRDQLRFLSKRRGYVILTDSGWVLKGDEHGSL